MFGGKVFIEEKYPHIIFAKDGEIYNIDGKSILIIGKEDSSYFIKFYENLLLGKNNNIHSKDSIVKL